MGITRKLVTSGLAVGGTLGAMALFNRLVENQAGELDTVLKGEERRRKFRIKAEQYRDAAKKFHCGNQCSPEHSRFETHLHKIICVGAEITYLRPAVIDHDGRQNGPRE